MTGVLVYIGIDKWLITVNNMCNELVILMYETDIVILTIEIYNIVNPVYH